MSIPGETLRWAETPEAVHPITGKPNRETPALAKTTGKGFDFNEKPPRQDINWFNNLAGLWAQYFDSIINQSLLTSDEVVFDAITLTGEVGGTGSSIRTDSDIETLGGSIISALDITAANDLVAGAAITAVADITSSGGDIISTAGGISTAPAPTAGSIATALAEMAADGTITAIAVNASGLISASLGLDVSGAALTTTGQDANIDGDITGDKLSLSEMLTQSFSAITASSPSQGSGLIATNVKNASPDNDFDAVTLPAGQAAGAVIYVQNTDTSPVGKRLTVFPPSGGTIKGLSVNAAEILFKQAISMYISEGSDVFKSVSLNPGLNNFRLRTFTTGITASATSDQAGGTVITTELNSIATVLTAGDSLTMPEAQQGMQIQFINDAGLAADLFPFLGDSHRSLAPDIALSLSTAVRYEFTCITAGTWELSNVE